MHKAKGGNLPHPPSKIVGYIYVCTWSSSPHPWFSKVIPQYWEHALRAHICEVWNVPFDQSSPSSKISRKKTWQLWFYSSLSFNVESIVNYYMAFTEYSQWWWCSWTSSSVENKSLHVVNHYRCMYIICNYMYNSHLEQMTAQNCTLQPWESCKCTKHVHVNEQKAVRAFKLWDTGMECSYKLKFKAWIVLHLFLTTCSLDVYLYSLNINLKITKIPNINPLIFLQKQFGAHP